MADLIFLNGNVVMPREKPGEPMLVAVRGKFIWAVAPDSAFNRLKTPKTRVIDCKGKTILPGFIDAHIHLRSFAENLVTLDLSPNNRKTSIKDMIDKISAYSAGLEQGSWIRGKGYNEFYLSENRHPTCRDLDKASLIHPIKLTHRSGHAHVLNSPALKEAGISKTTPDPEGGIIDRDPETGEPTGLLYEMGAFLAKKIPPVDNGILKKGVASADKKLASMGITTIVDASAGNDPTRFKTYRQWQRDGLLSVNLYGIMGADHVDELTPCDPGSDDSDRIEIKGVKIILDETTGRLHPSQPELDDTVLKIHCMGKQAVIHAVEEEAIQSACRAVEHALTTCPETDRRHRIEHCSLCTPELIEQISALGMVVVTQPAFLYYNGDRYLNTVPKNRQDRLYALKSLMTNRVTVAAGSDAPVAPIDPFVGLYAAVSRMSREGRPVRLEQKISPSDALKLYTINAAASVFEEKTTGSILPGKRADLIVVSHDPTTIPADDIRHIKVEMTVADGNIIWPE